MGGIRLYLWLVGAFFLIGALALLPPIWIGEEIIASSGREYARKEAAAAASVMALALERLPDGERLRLFSAAGAKKIGRFTLIDADGRVLADTGEDPVRMENHRNRPEVAAALAGRPGGDVRNSPTLGIDFIYAAVPLSGGAVVRCALPLAESNSALDIWRRRFLGGFVLSLAAIMGVGLILARILARPMELAAAGAERFAAGRLDIRLEVAGASEVRQLMLALNRMAAELDSRFRQLARQSGEMSAVIENMAEGLLAIDSSGLATLINPAARSLLGVGAEAIGRAAAAAIRHPDLLGLLRDVADSGEPLERDLRLSFENSDEDRLVHAHAARMRESGGGGGGVLAVLHDVTRLRQLETVRRDFIANVSHELRTPVTSIQGSLEALADEGFEDREVAGEFLDMAIRNVRRLGSIIGNLLLLAGMESGDPEEKGQPVVSPVAPILAEAVAVCR